MGTLCYVGLNSNRDDFDVTKLVNNNGEEKEQRLYELNKIVNDYSLENNKKLVGRIEKVLLTDISEKDNNKIEEKYNK